MTANALQPAGASARPASDLEAHRTELLGYCYRMLGSLFDAEDAVQETMIRAWRGLDRFEGRAALRSWLFGIATNVCIDLLNAGRRRALPMDFGPPAGNGTVAAGTPLAEQLWVTPVADARVLGSTADPADAAIARDGIRLAFVAALQLLNPRQRAVLILRDVLRWKAAEVAGLLGCSTTAVNSLLRRARQVLGEAPTGVTSGEEMSAAAARRIVERYVDAFASYDVEALVALLHEDVVLSMPPSTAWFRGRAEVIRWFGTIESAGCRDARSLAIVANGSPALASYRPTGPGGSYEPFAVQVFDLSDGRIAGIYAYIGAALFPLLGLPPRLAA